MPDAAVEGEEPREPLLPAALGGRRAALIVAHPGHELRLHGWLEAACPQVFVLTDGAGRSGRSRLASTARVLARTGARPGAVFGRFTDPDFYAALLDRDIDVFTALARRLAAALAGFDYVVADPAEGYNPAHDVCRFVVDAAVRLAGQRAESFEFSLVGPPEPRRASSGRRARLVLDDAALARKWAAADDYGELAGEVASTVGQSGRDAFRVEVLDPSAPPADLPDPPYYERYGEQQVQRGFFTRVIRQREHVRPLADALRSLAP